MLLEDRKAIVTGASSGIGKATAIRLAAEGSSVCVNYFSDRDADTAQAVVAEVEHKGGRGLAAQADVGDESQVIDMVEKTVAAFGGLDILVNNAGIENMVPTLEMPLKDWDRVLRTNLTGAFLCLREAGKVMAKSGGGVIVNMSSVHEFIPWPGFAHYCATKGGLKLLMQTAARELAEAKTGIRVLNIAPGRWQHRSTTSSSTTPRPSTTSRRRSRWGDSASPRRSPPRWRGPAARRPTTSPAPPSSSTAGCRPTPSSPRRRLAAGQKHVASRKVHRPPAVPRGDAAVGAEHIAQRLQPLGLGISARP